MKDNYNAQVITEVFMQMPALSFCVGIDNIIIAVNLLESEALGYSHPKDLIGKTLVEVFGKDIATPLIENNRLVIESKSVMVFEEMLTLSSNKSVVFISEKAPLYNAEGEVTGIVGISREVTRLYSHVDALRNRFNQAEFSSGKFAASATTKYTFKKYDSSQGILLGYISTVNNYYDDIISSMPGNVYWMDLEGKVLGINEGAATVLGLSRTDVIGRSLYEIMPADAADMTLDNNRKIIEAKITKSVHETVTLPDGVERTYFSTKRPLYGELGDVVGVLGTAIDITERKKIEREVVEQRKIAERASEAKTEFLLNMSHDLRTPCSGILGYVKIMFEQEKDEEKKQMLSCITQSSQHLLNLLNEILDYTRVDASLFEVKPRTENIRELLNSVVELLGSEIKRKGLVCSLLCDDTVTYYYVFNPVILHRIVLNLVSNAIKFSDSGSIHILVKYNEVDANLIVKVKDQGIGIDEKDKIRIFDKFTKVSNSYSGIHQGTGLGLATIVRLLDSVGGSIRVESVTGEGSTFIVALPAEVANSVEQEDVVKDDLGCVFYDSFVSLDIDSGASKRVLVVEDDHISKQVTNILLNSLGFEIVIVSSGHEALCENLQQFDLIIMDFGLPDMDGQELITKIRQWEVDHQVDAQAVVVAVTAHVDYKSKGQAALGFNAVMQKPLTMEKLELLFKRGS